MGLNFCCNSQKISVISTESFIILKQQFSLILSLMFSTSSSCVNAQLQAFFFSVNIYTSILKHHRPTPQTIYTMSHLYAPHSFQWMSLVKYCFYHTVLWLIVLNLIGVINGSTHWKNINKPEKANIASNVTAEYVMIGRALTSLQQLLLQSKR